MLRKSTMLAAFMAAVTALVGCEPAGSSLSGKVTTGGKDVTAGSLVFSPAEGAGKLDAGGAPVTVKVGSDGKYNATGVVPGKAMVTYNAPPDDYPEGYKPKPSEPPPASPFKNLVVKEKTIEVKKGASTQDIELVPATGKK